MVITRSTLRDQYGDCYLSVFSETLIVPWKPLSLGKFLEYEARIKSGDPLPVIIEDEIFRECVLDRDLVTGQNKLEAGIIATVAQNIMMHSGPQDIDAFNEQLNRSRQIYQDNPIHEMVGLIIRAFPGYIPDQIYAFDYNTFMLRLVQAEQLLLRMKFLDEPLLLVSEEDQKKKKKKKMSPADVRAAFEKQQVGKVSKQPAPTPAGPMETPKPTESPIFGTDGKTKVHKGLDQDRLNIENSAGSAEDTGLRRKMVEDAQRIYANVLNKLPSK